MHSGKMAVCLVLFLQTVLAMNAVAETGVFWQATSPQHQPVYLFGTMHSDDNRVTEFTQATIDAIAAVDVFMLETEQPKTPKPLLNKNKLADDLTEAEIDQVNALADQYVIARAFAMQMKPWLLAVIFDAPKPQTPFGQDHLLKAEAENKGKKIRALETVDAHFGVMDDVPREEQLALLKAVLKRSQDEKEADFEKVLKVYLSGDLDKILATNAKTTGDLVSDEIWQKMKVRLIEQRNLKMATRVIEAASAQSLFIAVGASHLAGESGLVAQLKQAGFSLQPLQGLKSE